MVYGVLASGILNIAPISVMAATQLFILGFDTQAVKSKRAPLWYMNFKYILTFLCFCSYSLFDAIYLNYGDKIKQLKQQNNDQYRKYIPTKTELLNNQQK